MDRFLTSFCEPNLNLTEKLPIMLNNLADKCKKSINVANIPKIIIFFQNYVFYFLIKSNIIVYFFSQDKF